MIYLNKIDLKRKDSTTIYIRPALRCNLFVIVSLSLSKRYNKKYFRCNQGYISSAIRLVPQIVKPTYAT